MRQTRGQAPPATRFTGVDLRFLTKAVVLMVVLYGAYYFPYLPTSTVGRMLADYLALQARGAAALIGLFDPSVTVHDTLIGGRFPLQVVKSCSSLDAQALYVAAVLAFPVRGWTKALGVAVGVAAMTALNLGRIASLYFVGLHTPLLFDAVHEEWLPLLLVACACTGFVVWARWAHAHAEQLG